MARIVHAGGVTAVDKALTQADRTTSMWYLYNLVGDPVAYKVAKYLLSEGFVPYIVKPPRFMGYDDRGRRLLAHWVLIRNRIKVPLTLSSYRGTLGHRRRRRKTSHTRSIQKGTA